MGTGKSPSGNGASRSERALAAALALLSLLALAGCGEEEGTTLRLAHSNSPSHPVHLGMLAMGERLAALSEGELRLKVYPSEQLGSERQAIELVQIGSLDLAKTSSAVMEAFAPEFAVFGLPYVFEDGAHERAVLEGPVGAGILASGADRRLLGLAYLDAGARSFYTVGAPVRTPEDLRGLKIRTQSSPSAIRLVEALGATPTPLAFGELYTALQQGVVDGAENNPPSYHLTRHYEVAPHYTLNEHTAVPDILVIGSETWSRLDEQERGWVRDAARHGAEVQRALWARAEQEALEAVTAGGAEIIRPDRAAFAARVQPLKQSAAEDPVLGPILERVRGAGEGTAP